MTRVAVVLAAGGERVVPWQTGVLAGFADAGVDLRDAELIVGTSAGAFVAARLALGLDPRDLAGRIVADGVPEPPPELVERAAATLPRLLAIQAETAGLEPAERARRVGRLALAARTISEEAHVAAATIRLPADDWPDSLRLMTADARTGERVPLDAGSGIPVGRGVAAARSLPGVLPAVTVGGRRLMDAVVVSATNADAARDAGHVVVITPAPAHPRPGTVDAVLEAALARELGALGGATVIRPDAVARAAMGEHLFGIVDAAAAVTSGRRTGRAIGGQMRPSRAA